VARLSRTPSPNGDLDAGLRGLSHYERRLPKWRFRLRQWLIPVVRWETPYLAYMQETLRSPWLDTYFALTANLGTHTFFMTALPICFWCGFPEMGLALVHMLAMGVYLSGFAKDLACLPRPLSPPLQRITMSGSAALEYGFPSTHTTNAVSVALYCLYQVQLARDEYTATTYNVLQAVFYCYASSITLGRMYCGMHGFFDIVFGAALGAVIAWIRIIYGAAFDWWILSGEWGRPAVVIAVLAVAIRVNPEPADNCPCFDDSVAFVGVVMGAAIGTWHYGVMHPDGPDMDAMYAFDNDLLKVGLRILCGVVVVFVWRAVMKPSLLRILPPVFRSVDRWGFRLPRRYFLQSR
jgi:dihydrosphingosine 1-phosphate phosphatase